MVDQRDGAGKEPTIPVQDLVQAEDDRRDEYRGELCRILALERGCPSAGGNEVIDPQKRRRRCGKAVDPHQRSNHRRLVDDHIGHEDRDGEELDQRRQLRPPCRGAERPAETQECPDDIGPGSPGHGRECQTSQAWHSVCDDEQDRGEPADRPEAIDRQDLLDRDHRDEHEQGSELPAEADEGHEARHRETDDHGQQAHPGRLCDDDRQGEQARDCDQPGPSGSDTKDLADAGDGSCHPRSLVLAMAPPDRVSGIGMEPGLMLTEDLGRDVLTDGLRAPGRIAAGSISHDRRIRLWRRGRRSLTGRLGHPADSVYRLQ